MNKKQTEEAKEQVIRYEKRDAAEKKKLSNRLNVIEGQIRGINKMLEDDRCSEDLLIQMTSIYNAIKSFSTQLLKVHLYDCIDENKKYNEEEKQQMIEEIASLVKIID